MKQGMSAQVSRRAMIRLVAVGTASTVASSLLAACGGTSEAPTATASSQAAGKPVGTGAAASQVSGTGAGSASATLPGKTLTIRNRGEIVNLDPHLGSGNPDAVIASNIYSMLVLTYPDARDKVIGDLATDWTVSPDSKEYVFHLRKGVQWHKNYGEVTAADVVWTFQRVLDPKLGSRSTAAFAELDKVVADDPYTVRITLKESDPTFLTAVLASVGYIGNRKAIEEKGNGYTSDPVGSGPYIFQSWTKGEQCVLVKNPGHWLHQGNVDKVNFKFLLDDKVTELSLRSGDLDMAYVETPESQKAVIDNANLTNINQPAARTHMLFLSEKEGTPTADLRVRQALAMGINRDLLAQQALSGLAQPAYSVFNPTLPGFVDTKFFPYDPAKAKQLLAAAGFANNLKIDFIGYSDGISPDIISVVQAQWKEIGVDAKVTILERALLYKRWQARDFEVLEQPAARSVPEQMIFPFFTKAASPYPNGALYTGIEQLATQLRTEPDQNKRVQLYGQIQTQIATDIPVIPTIYPKVVLGMRKGIDPFPVDIWYYPLWRMKVTK